MNRGSPYLAELFGKSPNASMRPRFMNRGSHDGRPHPARPATGFNEAPIHESGKYGTPIRAFLRLP